MPTPDDLIEALRQFERMSGASNPYTNPYERQSMAAPLGGMDDVPFKADRIGPIEAANSQGDFSDELMQRYMAHLDKMPKRNKPSLMQKIFGGLASVNDPKAGQDILYGSYNRAMDDWKAQADEIYRGSSQERLYNVNRRQQEAQESQEKYRQGQLDVANRRVANAEARTAIAREKQNNPGGKVFVTEDGSLVSIDPHGNPTFVLKSDGTPVKSNELSDEQVINMRLSGDLQKIQAGSDAAMKLESARNTNRLGQIRASGAEARETKQVVPGGAAAGLTRAETPAARNQRIRNNANEFRAQFPKLAGFITIDGTNVSITDPATSGGPTEEQYNQMYESIFNDPAVNTDIELKPESGSSVITPSPEASAVKPSAPVLGSERKQLPPDVLKRAMAGVEPGKVLVTNGTEYGQMTLENAKKLKEPGWYVVGSKE